MNFRNLKWAKLYKFVLSGPPSKKKKQENVFSICTTNPSKQTLFLKDKMKEEVTY